jgi:hypothetical protein
LFGWHLGGGERKIVPVSMNLFPIAATAFLVGLAVVFVVFTVKYIGGRVGGRGPLGLFSHPAVRTPSTTTTKRATVRRRIPNEVSPRLVVISATRTGRSPVSPCTAHRPFVYGS